MIPENRKKRQLYIEFIKSGAILLLAIILLLSAVFAWFGGAEEPTIEPFKIKISDGNMDSELGSSVVTSRTVVLPCATKLGDEEISVDDFSKAIKMIPLEVESNVSNNVAITIETVPGLHFYIDTDYDKNEDTALSYSQIINDNHTSGTGNDLSTQMIYTVPDDFNEEDNVYRHWVAVIYWADYDDYVPTDSNGRTVGQIIDEEGVVGLNSTMSFKVVHEDGE